MIKLDLKNLVTTEISQARQISYLANWEMLQQAFFHPLVNAIKFNNVGGSITVEIKLKVEDYKPYLEFTL